MTSTVPRKHLIFNNHHNMPEVLFASVTNGKIINDISIQIKVFLQISSILTPSNKYHSSTIIHHNQEYKYKDKGKAVLTK